MQPDLVIAPGITIPGAHLQVSFSRSGGPGGQNVNKVSSRVAIEVDVVGLQALSADQKARLRRLAGRRISKDGVLRIVSQTTRDQSRNLEDARERIREIFAASLVAPKIRTPTRVTRGARRARLEDKRRRSEIKRARGRVSED